LRRPFVVGTSFGERNRTRSTSCNTWPLPEARRLHQFTSRLCTFFSLQC
jgi:hypothetical protein